MPPHGSVDVERRALLEGVGGHDRRGEVGVAVGAQLPGGARRARSRSPASSSGTPMTPVEATATWLVRHAARRSPRRPASSRRRRARGRRWRRSRCPSWRRRRAGRRAARAACVTTTGAASTPERVKRAALVGVGRVADEQPDVGVARRLQAGRDARPRGSRRGSPPGGLGDAVGHLDPARAEERRRGRAHAAIPAVSSRPNMRLRFCTACDECPSRGCRSRRRRRPCRCARRAARRSGTCSCRGRRARRATLSTISTNGSCA